MSFKFIPAVALALAVAPLASAATTFVGYTGPNADRPTLNGTELTNSQTAALARTSFLSQLSGYYYEDFQGQPSNFDTRNFNHSSINNNYNLTLGSVGVNLTPAPAASVSDTTGSNPNGSRLGFDKGTITNVRGNFGAFDSSLTAAIPGQSLATADNWYLDLAQQSSATFRIAPGQRAIGLMLNDVIQPSATTVAINFLDGSTNVINVLGALKSNGTPGGTLTSDGTWFIGFIADQSVSSITINSGGDPMTIDNIYLSSSLASLSPSPTAIPLPAAASSSLALLSLATLRRKRA